MGRSTSPSQDEDIPQLNRTKEDDPLDDELCKGGLTHARCAEAFGEKVAPYAL